MTEKDEQIIRSRSVYSSGHGITELAEQLEELGFFGYVDPHDPAECSKLNYARQLLFNRLGLDVHTPQGREEFVQAVLGLPPKLEEP